MRHKLSLACLLLTFSLSISAHAYDSRDVIVTNNRAITLKATLLGSNPPSGLRTTLFEAIFPELYQATTYIVLPPAQCPTHIVCKWVVEDGMLYLTQVEPYTKDLFPREALPLNERLTFDISNYIPTQDSIKSRVERLTGQTFNERGLLPATWISGTITGGVDFVSYEYFLNRASIEIENGRVIKEKLSKRKAKLYDNPEAIDSLLTNGITLWDEFAKCGMTLPILFENRDNIWQANLSGWQQNNKKLVELTKKIGEEIAAIIKNIPRKHLSSPIFHFTRHRSLNRSNDRFLAITIFPKKRTVDFSNSFHSLLL